ncbi:MAG: DNA polymerase III subunit beta [Anaerolineae bacterium]
MKVSCLQENLARGLGIVGRAVATRSTLPVLSNIILEAEESRLKLSATNLEIGIHCWIGAKVDDAGAITVPARLLTDFVGSLPPERIDMELSVRTQTLNLKCARFEANIKGIDAQEFPLIPTAGEMEAEEGTFSCTLEPATFRRNIEQVSFAAATDENRPTLTGILARFQGEKLTLAAADGFRLSVRETSLESPAPGPTSIIIPARSMNELGRIIQSVEGEALKMLISRNRNQVLFHLANVDLISQLIEGNFPDYSQIIPKSYETRTVLNTFEFLKAARMAEIFARDSAYMVHLKVEPAGELGGGTMTLLATAAEIGDNVGQIDASVEGQPLEIAFNVRYLIDVLSVMDSERVALELTNPSSPGVLKPVGEGEGEFLCVIMPMHLR